MRLYDYKCPICGAIQEELVSGGIDPKTLTIACDCGGSMAWQFPKCVVFPDYSDMKHFFTEQHADRERSKVGIGAE